MNNLTTEELIQLHTLLSRWAEHYDDQRNENLERAFRAATRGDKDGFKTDTFLAGLALESSHDVWSIMNDVKYQIEENTGEIYKC